MKPEKHAIRDLERSLDKASPEEAEAINRVIYSLNVILLNKNNPDALPMCREHLAKDVAALDEILKPKK